jgi:hypothetical protein
VGLPEDAIEHVKVLRDSEDEEEIIEAMNALVGMLPQESTDAECVRWASVVWEDPGDILAEPPDPWLINTAREELARLHAGGGHLTWDDDD